MKKGILLILSLCISFSGFSQEWEELFNGKDFNNFQQLNGKAEFKVMDGVMAGISTWNTPNSFLATKKTYGDFILEFDVMVDNGLNSGVQFRSLSTPEYNKGRVHGYQVEIETSPRKWAGGVYDEARRGWLYPLSMNPKGQDAFKPGEWNHYRVEAYGNIIRTFINGIMCTNLVDAETDKGFIAFQVHSIGDKALIGKKVQFKNIGILTKNVADHMFSPDPDVPEVSYLNNELTKSEKRKGWRLLWNGKNNEGWRGAKLDHFPEKGWTMENGILKVLASGGGESSNGGDIITKDVFSDFELMVDFKITSGANSGIKYFVDPELNKGEGSAIGLEFQILDDNKHPDAKMGVSGNRTVGSLYDIIRADNLSEANNNSKRMNGVGQWNRAYIISKDGKVEHWLNGVKVVEFDRYTQMFRSLVEKSKYTKWPNFGQLSEGHILLQDHGDEVWFRNIKIREL